MLASTPPHRRLSHRLLAQRVRGASSVTLLLAACLLAASGCAPFDDAPPEDTQAAAFALSPSISLHAARPDIQLDRVFMGVGNIFLEPLDVTASPLVAAASSMPLTFILDAQGAATIHLPEVALSHAGRYLVSIAIEPLAVPADADWPAPVLASAPKNGFSLMIQGLVMHTLTAPGSDGDHRKDEPEPLPWRINTPKDNQQHNLDATSPYALAPTVECIPFEYQSDRTGFIRLGEVKLSPERSALHINIDLGAWIDAAVIPIIADINTQSASALGKTPAPGSDRNGLHDLVDLSEFQQLQGLGIEQVFGKTRAEAR
jgi:hypothetical protein